MLLVYIYLRADNVPPPEHPLLSFTHDNNTYGDICISGHSPSRYIFIRSLNIELTLNAQHEPQYYGIC